MIGLKNEGINQLWKHHVCSRKQLPHNSVINRANDEIKTEFLVSTLLLLSSSPSSTRRFTSERLITHALCYQIVTYWSPRMGNHCDLRSTSLWYSQWSCLSPWEMFYFFFLNIYLTDKPYCFRIYHSNFFFFFNQELVSEDNIFTTLRYRYKWVSFSKKPESWILECTPRRSRLYDSQSLSVLASF